MGALPVGVVRVDRQGAIAAANLWFSEWVGVTADRLVGSSVTEHLVHASEDLFSADGPGPWMMVHAHAPDRAVMVSRHRQGACDVLLVAEASERFRALIDLRARYALADRTRTRLELVMDSSVAFAAATTDKRLAEILADTTARAYQADGSTVLLREAAGSYVVASGRDALGGRGLPSSPPRSECRRWWVLQPAIA
jgi:hypothetical protein